MVLWEYTRDEPEEVSQRHILQDLWELVNLHYRFLVDQERVNKKPLRTVHPRLNISAVFSEKFNTPNKKVCSDTL